MLNTGKSEIRQKNESALCFVAFFRRESGQRRKGQTTQGATQSCIRGCCYFSLIKPVKVSRPSFFFLLFYLVTTPFLFFLFLKKTPTRQVLLLPVESSITRSFLHFFHPRLPSAPFLPPPSHHFSFLSAMLSFFWLAVARIPLLLQIPSLPFASAIPPTRGAIMSQPAGLPRPSSSGSNQSFQQQQPLMVSDSRQQQPQFGLFSQTHPQTQFQSRNIFQQQPQQQQSQLVPSFDSPSASNSEVQELRHQIELLSRRVESLEEQVNQVNVCDSSD